MNDTGGANNNALKFKTLTFAVVLGVLGVGAFWLSARKPPPALHEVSRAALLMRDGRLYETNKTVPFTGVMIETYSNLVLLSRSEVSNGLLNGVSEMYYTNAQLQLREHFRDSVSDGLRQKWHENGALMSEAHIVHGKVEDTFRRWHANGQLAEQIQMKDGKPDGTALAYYASGFLKAQTRVAQGEVLGRQSWVDGQLRQPPIK